MIESDFVNQVDEMKWMISRWDDLVFLIVGNVLFYIVSYSMHL